MKKKKIILIIIMFVITLILIGLLIYKNYDKEELVIQTNERDQTKEQIEITNEYINIRSDYDSSSELLGKVYKDEIYTVLEKQEDEYYTWCKIETTNGIVGYIAVKYQEENYVEFLEIVDEEIEVLRN